MGTKVAATLKDIALSANVSTATVSRYLNSPEVVSPKTSKAIAQAIKENNYTPNDIARSLITQNSYTIGVILPDINNSFYPPVLRGIESTAEQHDYIMFLCNTDRNMQREKKYIDVLLSKRVAGIIMIGTRPSDTKYNKYILSMANKMPVMLLYDMIEDESIRYVAVDEVMGSYKATKHCIDLGHKDIAFVSAPLEYTTYIKKQEGYCKALEEAGIPLRKDRMIYQEAYEMGGYRAMHQFIETGKPLPTAVHTVNDQMAVGVLRAALEHGLSIPRDLTIIGFSNAPISSQVYPKLSTVNQFAYEIGRMGTNKVIQMINKSATVKSELLLPELVIRDSSGAIQ
jgi:DNA-binding LacI/PurR family transcriptional regulator